MVRIGLGFDAGNRFWRLAFLRLGADDLHRNRDSIAAFRQRLDIVLVLNRSSKFAAQKEDVLGEISFLDKTVGPRPSISSCLLTMIPGRSTKVRRVFRALGGIDTILPLLDRTMRSASKM